MIQNNAEESSANISRTASSVIRHQVNLLYMQAPISNTSAIIVTVLIYIILRTRIESNVLLAWLLILPTAALFRLYLWYTHKRKPDLKPAKSWLTQYLIGCAMVGCSWSLVYVFLYPAPDLLVLTILLMLAFGVSSAAIPVLAASMPAFMLYTYPQVMMLVISCLRYEDATYNLLALGVLLYLVMITLFTRNTNRSILKTAKLQEQNAILIRQLNKEIGQREEVIMQRTGELEEKNQILRAEVQSREQAEEKLQSVNRDLDATLRAIPDLLFELDENGRYLDMWVRDPALLIADRVEYLGHFVTDVLPPDAARVTMQAIREAARYGGSQGQIIEVPLSDGPHWFELSTSRKEQPDGTSNYLMLSRDISDKYRMEAELQQAHKMEAIGTLAGGIAHDFNNILGAILGYAEMAKDDLPEGSRVRDDLDKVLLAGTRAKELVAQILAFSRQAKSEQKILQPQPLVEEAIKLLRSSIPSTIAIKENLGREDVCIRADPTQLQQVIMNLCTNAFHAMEESGGTLTVGLEHVELTENDLKDESTLQPGPYLRLIVQDTGSGIDPVSLVNIFDPYFTTKEVGKGTGMGLAVVHGIVKNHGGIIRVFSKLGEGTVFHVYFPALSGVEEGKDSTDADIPTGNERILFVDDEQFLVDIVKQLLGGLGYRVTGVTESQEALALFQSRPDEFDMVITDQTMPGMTGADLAREILDIRPELPVILCTGYSGIMSREKAKAIGIREFVMKPVVKKDIAPLIRQILDDK